MKILAFGHQKRVGKDTAAQFVMTHARSNSLFKSVQRKGFADKLKQVCFELYSWAGLMPGPWYEEEGRGHLKEVVLPKLGKSPRAIWIAFGNEVKNAAYIDTWVDYLLHAVKCDFLIVSDMRFPREADRVRAMGGMVVKIVRPEIPHTSDAADDPLLDYQNWDHVIVNTDLGKFHKDVVSLVSGGFCK